jgi:lipopolysaccharide/colanic/teichoic acid biosynthesis glycosyltransferase
LEHGGEESVALTPTVLAGGANKGISVVERVFDVVLIVLLSPVILLVGAAIALAIYVDSPGPVIFRSWRVGRDGVPFGMLKFRKMKADAGDHPVTLADDERFTPIGRFLSATRLDELPQVWNVVRGEMRLVGPRPELECFVAQFAPEYDEILTALPGITGKAQLRFLDEKVLLGGDDPAGIYSEHVMPEKIKIDLDYVRSRSLMGDLALIGRTVALPATLLLNRMRARSRAFRVWLPTAASAALLVLMFVITSSHIS